MSAGDGGPAGGRRGGDRAGPQLGRAGVCCRETAGTSALSPYVTPARRLAKCHPEPKPSSQPCASALPKEGLEAVRGTTLWFLFGMEVGGFVCSNIVSLKKKCCTCFLPCVGSLTISSPLHCEWV